MAKYYGVIGFATSIEKSPGIWIDDIFEKFYYGELLRNNRRWQKSDGINDNITISNQFSIISDPYLNDNIQNMRYIVFRGVKWNIEDIEIQYPRILITIGGVYSEQETGLPQSP